MKDDFRDDSGGITVEWCAGIYAESKDCINWQIADNQKTYSRKVQWEDGKSTVQVHLECPNLLFINGKPAYLFAATGKAQKLWQFEGLTHSICVPIEL